MRGSVCSTQGLVVWVGAAKGAMYIDEKLDPHGSFEGEVVGSFKPCMSLRTSAEANGDSVPRITIANGSETFGPLKEVRR